MRCSRLFSAVVAAVVLGPLLAVGSAYADPTAPPPTAGASPGYQDVQLPPDPGDDGADASVPLPFSASEDRMVSDYLAKRLTAQQFVALGISASVGGPLPAKYQDQQDNRGDDGRDSGWWHWDGFGHWAYEAGDSHASSTRSDDAATALSPPTSEGAVTPTASPSTSDDSADTSSDPSTGTVAGDNGDSSQFLEYVFAVAASEPAADQEAFANMFEPTPGDDADSASTTSPSAPQRSALALSSAALPADPQCATPASIKLSPILDILKQVIPGPVLNLKLPAPTVFPCVATTAHFRVYYSLASKDKTNGVADQARASNGVPVYINHVTSALENAYGYYTRLGYKQPPGQVTVLISSFWGAMHNGAGFTPPPVASHQFIVMDNQGSEFYLPSHELFHTFQYRYIAVAKYLTPSRFENMNWWMEATAEWAAHRAMASSSMSFVDLTDHDESTWYDQKLPSFLGTPGRRLDDWAGLGGQTRQYGAFVFAEFLADDFGTSAVLHTWEHIGSENGHLGSDYFGGGTYPVHAIAETLAGYGTSYQQQLPIFAKAVYQLGPDTLCAMPSVVMAPSSTASPASVCYGDYPSNQFQFTDSDLSDWIYQLGHSPEITIPANDPSPSNPRPNHSVVALNASRASGTHSVEIEPGGMYFADLTWAGNPYEDIAVTVHAPKGSHLHVSLIGWTSYRERCELDRDADVPAAKSVTLQSLPIDTCSFATVIITDTDPNDSQNADITTASWSTSYLNPPIYY